MKFLKSLMFIFMPHYWLMNSPYNEEWDRVLSALMQANKFESIGECRAKIGNITVWTCNHPYASFTPYCQFVSDDIRPSRTTIRLAMKKLKAETEAFEFETHYKKFL